MGRVGGCGSGLRPCPVPLAFVRAGDPLARARSVPLKHERESVVGAGEGGHRLLARFCLIRSARARFRPAARARRMPGPRP